MTSSLPSLLEIKAQAKALRAQMSRNGKQIGHAHSLELMAHRLGYRDWNALHAVIGARAPGSWVPGGRVQGRYLSQPFEASVISSRQLRPGWFRLALELDEPVDVVRFESFSNLRKRIQCVVGPSGTTREKTSDGQPHVVLEMGL